jgi:hypothetical protein
MSRSSSVSTKDKAGQSKRPKPAKQRRDDSDSFDVRSQYTPFFPQQPVQGPTWAPAPQYAPMGPQQPFNGVVQNNYQNPMPPQFVPSAQQFNPVMMNSGNIQPYNNMPQVSKIYCEFSVPWLTKYSNILSKHKHDSSHTVLQSLHTGLLSNRRQLLPSNGNNHQSTRVHTNPKDQWSEDPQTRFRTRLASCQVLQILQTQRVSIRYLVVIIGTHSIRRPSPLYPAMLVSRFLSRCHIMVLLTMGPHIMALHISTITPSLRHSSHMATEWATPWLDRVQTTLCHLITHLLTWHIGQ